MIDKRQDSSNSSRESQVGGYFFDFVTQNDYPSQSLIIGEVGKYNFFRNISVSELGYGFFGVGKDPFGKLGDWYHNILSNGVLEKSTKYNFSSQLVYRPIINQGTQTGLTQTPQTPLGALLNAQSQEFHIFGTHQFSQIAGIGYSSVYFEDYHRKSGILIPPCQARAFRLLLNVNGIQRVSATQSRSFSAYWDVAGGVINQQDCGSSFTWIGSGTFSQISKNSLLDTGNVSLGATPSLVLDISNTLGLMIIEVRIIGTFSMIGSGKMTLVESGTFQTDYIKPV